MGTGFLEVLTIAANGAMPVPNARVTIFNGDNILYELVTDENGTAEVVPLEAPAVELTLDPEYNGVPYSICDVKAEAKGFATAIIHGVEILDTETSVLPIDMLPQLEEGQVSEYYTPPHNLVAPVEARHMEGPPPMPANLRERVLSEVIIPEFITVHLGRPDNPNARNVRVPFTYYIKNSASHEIFSTWPPASLEANIYCIISFTLNRIFTEWYRVRGHSFDITNSTQFDQMFVENGQIFRSIDEMVDRIFNRFIRREGFLEPFFAEYCDGRRVHCPGLWQWSTVTLAQQGLNALQILRRFYPNDIQIVETDNIGGVQESFPGFTLSQGMSGPEVAALQRWLNRIRVNFPVIPQIVVNGVYGPQTEAAVRAFQGIPSLSSVAPNGVVNRTTWFNISRAFSAVTRLGELTSEGIIVGIGRTPPTDIIRQGSRGTLVGQAQYIMNFISEFYHDVPSVVQDSNFGPNFTAAVREFQRLFGLNPDGVIGPLTWRRLYEVYWGIRDNVDIPGGGGGIVVPPPPPPPPPPGGIPPYPGQPIRVGARGDDVQRIQRCLNSVNNAGLTADGIFGPLTQNAVMNFQRSRGLNPDGVVGPLTWGALMPACYGSGGGAMGAYPGFLIRQGDRNDYVRQIQTCLNRVQNAGLATDGTFGPLTFAAVRNFQQSRGLNPDGIVGPLTWGALASACNTDSGTAAGAMGAYPGTLIRQGDRNDYVQQIQTCLNRVHGSGLATDGSFGPITHTAVVSYQRAHGLTPDGIVGPLTWEHLRSRCSGSPAAAPTIAPVLIPRTENITEFWELNNFPLAAEEDIVVEVAPGVKEDTIAEDDKEIPVNIADEVTTVQFPAPNPADIEEKPTHCGRPDCAHASVLPIHPELMPPIHETIPQPPAPPSRQHQNRFHRDDLLVCIMLCYLCRR